MSEQFQKKYIFIDSREAQRFARLKGTTPIPRMFLHNPNKRKGRPRIVTRYEVIA